MEQNLNTQIIDLLQKNGKFPSDIKTVKSLTSVINFFVQTVENHNEHVINKTKRNFMVAQALLILPTFELRRERYNIVKEKGLFTDTIQFLDDKHLVEYMRGQLSVLYDYGINFLEELATGVNITLNVKGEKVPNAYKAKKEMHARI